MAALTQAEVDSLLKELGPQVDTPEHRVNLGTIAYKALFTAHPDYVSKFSKLQGLNAGNVMESEGIKYYARTLVDEIVSFLKAGANDAELKKLTDASGKAHTSRNVTKAEFEGALPIFIDVFNGLLSAGNKESMEKLMKHVFPAIAGGI